MALNKRYLPLLGLIPVLFAAYFVTLNDGVSFNDEVQAVPQGGLVEKAHLIGHLTLTVYDDAGNIVHYAQSDNTIVNNGENCMMKLLFGASTGAAGNSVCTGANTVGFRYIGLEASNTAVVETDHSLNAASGSAGLDTPIFSSAVWTNSTGTSSSAIVELTSAFTNTGAADIIYGAGLFNSTDIGDGMAAHTLVGSPPTVNNGDTLTATWTFTFAGA